MLACVDAQLCAAVAEGLGLPVPAAAREPARVDPSPALSQLASAPGPVDGRHVGVIVSDGADLAGVAKLRTAVEKAGATLLVIAPHGGFVSKGKTQVPVDRTFLTVRSIELDAVVVAKGTSGADDLKVQILLHEMYRHCKAIGAWGDGVDALTDAGIELDRPGILVAEAGTAAHRKDLLAALALHRAWDRFPEFTLTAKP